MEWNGMKMNKQLTYFCRFRRMKGDLIEKHKTLTVLDKMDVDKMFPLIGKSRTSGYCIKIICRPFKRDVVIVSPLR